MTSLALTGTGVFATLFDNPTGKDISTTLSARTYFILSATADSHVAYKPGFVDNLKQHWWKFIIIGLSDFYSTCLRTNARIQLYLSGKQPGDHNQHLYIICCRSGSIHDENKIQVSPLCFHCHHAVLVV